VIAVLTFILIMLLAFWVFHTPIMNFVEKAEKRLKEELDKEE